MAGKAILALEDGTVFKGHAFGASGESYGEVVFNTSMIGYTEILTDPSYTGQIVCMTYPLIGNYGVTEEDFESNRVFLSGFVVKEKSRIASNWRSHYTLDEFLIEQGIPGIEGIDTRKLVKHIREAGAMRGVLSTLDENPEILVEKARKSPSIAGSDMVSRVTTKNPFKWIDPIAGSIPPQPEFKVVVYDFGIKYNILRSLVSHGCDITIVPANTKAEDVLRMNPDGIFLSNGPGDPEALPWIISEIKDLIGRKPIFGICLGHQILALALGAKTYKLKFGHHGGNHPVIRLSNQQIEITCQNHGFAVNIDSIKDNSLEITHINLNDQTIEGLSHCNLPIFSVQYHPESGPGPHDSRYLFKTFTDMMRKFSNPAEIYIQGDRISLDKPVGKCPEEMTSTK